MQAETREELTPKQQRALAALLTQPTIKQAAHVASVAEPTMHRWLKQPDFQHAYRQARWEAVRHAIAHSQQASEAAVQALYEIMRDPGVKSSNRIAAARAILDTALRGIELEDLEIRILELEDAQQGVRT